MSEDEINCEQDAPPHLTFDNLLLSKVTISSKLGPRPLVNSFLDAALSPSTRRSYQLDVRHFVAWGGTIPTTPEIVATYLASHADQLTAATLNRRVVAIGRAHTMQGLLNPTSSDIVRMTMRGIRRTIARPQRQAKAALQEDVVAMVQACDGGLHAVRDKAVLLLGFAGAFRRSELVGLEYVDLERISAGLIVKIRRSKTDQEGRGRKIGIPYGRGSICPVRATFEWLDQAQISEGPIFRSITRHGHISSAALSAGAIATIIKRRVEALNWDSAPFSGHSLRAGFATSAARAGAKWSKIRNQTGHVSDHSLQRYIRDGELFVDNAAAALF